MLSGILETDSKCIDIDILNVVLKMNWMATAEIKPTINTPTAPQKQNIFGCLQKSNFTFYAIRYFRNR